MQQIFALLVLVLGFFMQVEGANESYYSIIAPGVIKPFRNYTVVVTLHEALEQAKFNIRINGPYYQMNNVVYLQPNETKSAIFRPEKLVEGPHKLVVEGASSGQVFRNESPLIAHHNVGPKVCIQTDKAVYRPGEQVQYRVLILDEHTRPLQIDDPVRIEIMDGQINRVRLYNDVDISSSVYTGEFQLSHYPLTADWKIRVTIGGKYDYREEKVIHVRKYRLHRAAVLDRSNSVIMQHGDKKYSANLNSSGEGMFEFDHNPNAQHLFRSGNSTFNLANQIGDNSLADKSDSYLNLKIKKNALPWLHEPLEIVVNSSVEIPYLVYTIMGHSNIIHAERIYVPAGHKTYTIKLIPSLEMINHGFVYVHFIQDGILRYAELDLELPLEFENKVDVTAPTETKPGQEVTFEVKAQAGSLIGLLAVDIGVYFFDPSYDLNRDTILASMKADVSTLPFPASVYPGLLSGVITLTNAHYEFKPASAQKAESPATASRAALISSRAKPLRYRERFPETWIFQNYEIRNNITHLKFKMPDTITSWSITAFSLNEKTGLGIINRPTYISNNLDFYIRLHLPYSVKPPLSFLIQPKILGEISLRVSTTSSQIEDGVIRKLRVEPEGVMRRRHTPLYINGWSGKTIRTLFHIDLPHDVVPQSEVITLSISGDPLAPTLKNLNDLVVIPLGSAEEDIVNFAANVLVLQYLQATGRDFTEKKLMAKLKNFLEIRYQQQLSYRHSNGGYSVFGQANDAEPSTWLTAYVVRFFIKATKYLPVMEAHIVDSGLSYLNLAEKYKGTIDNGLKFLNDNLESNTDIYALSIIAMAMQMAQHANASKVLDKLEEQKQRSDARIWWSQNHCDHANDVEITAYVLLALLLETPTRNAREEHEIFTWLTEQRNERGGFKSTHDTIVGLQALVAYSEKYNTLDTKNLRVKYSAKDFRTQNVKSGELQVDENNLLILQIEEFPKSTRGIDIEVIGSGNAFVQLYYHYNTILEDKFVHFRINPKAKLVNPELLRLEICFSYREDDNSTATQLILMEVNLPSGFATNEDYANELLKKELVNRFELKNSDTTLIVYSEKLSANIDNCFTVMADKLDDVVKRKPASVEVYDYYNISRHDTAYYNI
ncbi:thioester-containing protein 1 allele S3-like [Musca vetustissima]|uniref:thioester-containing protein 1 allele S3-like n=1 Tax=Musca vetustissima TaxID=27455 RepID=UPI002AB65CCE|nr:thioester-containing protein 1 allele S3-like [Musca vetustissima]